MHPEDYRYCRYEVQGPLLTLTIDRREVLNALHSDAYRELADAFDRYAADAAVRVAIAWLISARCSQWDSAAHCAAALDAVARCGSGRARYWWRSSRSSR